jgi:hypothetical protein
MVLQAFNKFRRFEGKPTLANKNRLHFRDQEWRGIRAKVILQVAAGGIAFILWFLACLSYVYGTLYLSPGRHAALHVLAVDHDGGAVGEALKTAYEQLKGPGFFTMVFHSPEEYPTEADMYQAVWSGDYWASISATWGASDRLSAALKGGEAAAAYDQTKALHYVWDQQYYTSFANSAIQGHMTQLVATARLAYTKINGTQALRSLNESDSAAMQAFFNPIQAAATNIKAATFGTATLLNAVSMAMPVLQQFFFLLVLNGVLGAHNLYEKMTVLSSLRFRRFAGLLFTLGAALCQAGYIWAFRESWDVDGNQFVLTWMTYWLLMHVHVLILDTISTLAPLPVMPFVVLFWILVNIASTLTPLELQAGFYHWAIALPSHEAYSVLVTIWTGGAHDRLYRALPILFAWWVVANITTTLAHIRACHLAYKLDKDKVLGQAMEDDVEAGAAEAKEESISMQDTLARTGTRLTRHRTLTEEALERREVYGPSIPPFA